MISPSIPYLICYPASTGVLPIHSIMQFHHIVHKSIRSYDSAPSSARADRLVVGLDMTETYMLYFLAKGVNVW